MKKFFSVVLVFSIFLSFFAGVAFAKNDDNDTPEIDGTYDVPGHPNLKVRVFVHNSRPLAPALTCPDPLSSSVVHPAGWHLPQGQWNYVLNVLSVPSGAVNLVTISSDALSRWSNAASGKVTFRSVGTTAAVRQSLDGQNIIAWGRTQGTALAVTYTWYNKITHEAVETDTIMNTKFQWDWSGGAAVCPANPNVYDAQDILTHELGHWVGLDDEYTTPYRDNTMYGYGAKGEIKKDTLTTGDINGVKALY